MLVTGAVGAALVVVGGVYLYRKYKRNSQSTAPLTLNPTKPIENLSTQIVEHLSKRENFHSSLQHRELIAQIFVHLEQALKSNDSTLLQRANAFYEEYLQALEILFYRLL